MNEFRQNPRDRATLWAQFMAAAIASISSKDAHVSVIAARAANIADAAMDEFDKRVELRPGDHGASVPTFTR